MLRRLRLLFLGLLLTSAVGLSAASMAVAKDLVFFTGNVVLPTPAPLSLATTNTMSWSFVTGGGFQAKCESSTLSGELKSNGIPHEKAELPTSTFLGMEEPPNKNCAVTQSPKPTGVKVVAPPTLIAVFEGKSVDFGEVSLTFTFPAETGAPDCVYEDKNLKGKFEPGKTGQPAPVEIALLDQKFELKGGVVPGLCPKKGTLGAEYKSVTSGGNGVSAELAKD